MEQNKSLKIEDYIQLNSKVKWEPITIQGGPTSFITGIGVNEKMEGGTYSTKFLETILPDSDEEYDDQEPEIKAITQMVCTAVNNSYGAGINPEAIRELLSALENILLDAEPMKGGEQVAIPSVSIKMIKSIIKKAKL